MDDMGRALVLIEPASPFWASLRESGVSIDVGGWRSSFALKPTVPYWRKSRLAPVTEFRKPVQI